MVYAAALVAITGLAALTAIAGIGQPERRDSAQTRDRPSITQPPNTQPPNTKPADSARLELVAALSNSDNISFRLKISTSYVDEQGRPFIIEGALDPHTRTGRLYSPYQDGTGFYEERLIEGDLYTGANNAPFTLEPGKHDRINFLKSLGGSALPSTADPQELFQQLQKANATVTQTGPDAYHFEADLPTDPNYGMISDRIVGDAIVNADKRIAKISYVRTAETVKNGERVTLKNQIVEELSGYGEPVIVERPHRVRR